MLDAPFSIGTADIAFVIMAEAGVSRGAHRFTPLRAPDIAVLHGPDHVSSIWPDEGDFGIMDMVVVTGVST